MKFPLFLHRIFRGGKWSTEAFVKKQCESDLDEIFGLNSIFLFSYFMINHFKKIFSNFFSIPEINASANLVTRECVNIHFVPTITISFIRSRA